MSLKRAFKHLTGRKTGERELCIRELRGMPIGVPLVGCWQNPHLLAYAEEQGWVKSNHLTNAGLRAAFPWAVEFLFRQDRGIWEGLCKHGVGHPIGKLKKGGHPWRRRMLSADLDCGCLKLASARNAASASRISGCIIQVYA